MGGSSPRASTTSRRQRARQLYEVDLATGNILNKVDTSDGRHDEPSGFNHIAAFADNINNDNTAGTLRLRPQGNVWSSTCLRLASARGWRRSATPAEKPSHQARMELALIDGFPSSKRHRRYLGTTPRRPGHARAAHHWAYSSPSTPTRTRVSYGNTAPARGAELLPGGRPRARRRTTPSTGRRRTVVMDFNRGDSRASA